MLSPTITQDSEGDTASDPLMVNLETAGFWHSERISDQKPKKYNFFSALSKVSQAFKLQASISQSIIVFPMTSNRKLRVFGKFYSKLEKLRENISGGSCGVGSRYSDTQQIVQFTRECEDISLVRSIAQ